MTTPIPYDLEAERAFVASLLCSDGNALDDLPGVDVSLCYDFTTRAVLGAMLDLRENGNPSDAQSVICYLQANEQPLAGNGWIITVTSLFGEGVPSNVRYYLEKLQGQLCLRRLQALCQWTLANIGPGADAAALLAATNAKLAKAEPIADTEEHALPAVADVILRELDEMDAGNKPKILLTPLNVWNNAFGGLPPASYLALGGRPGTGKSAMMEQIIYALIEEDIPVCVFEKDMGLKMFVLRLACRAMQVPYWKYAKGFSSTPEREAIRQCIRFIVKQNCLRLHNPHKLSAEMLASIVRREKRLNGIQAVFLDHVQLLHTGGEKMREGLTQASMTLRASASDTDIPHTVLFHVNRNGAKGGRPAPEDVKEFDQLLGDVDGMAMLWSETKPVDLKPGEDLEVNFYCPKNRVGGTSEDPVDFRGNTMTFINKE